MTSVQQKECIHFEDEQYKKNILIIYGKKNACEEVLPTFSSFIVFGTCCLFDPTKTLSHLPEIPILASL